MQGHYADHEYKRVDYRVVKHTLIADFLKRVGKVVEADKVNIVRRK